MKTIIFCLGLCLVACMSCTETTKTETSTNNADTAVLVQDTANTLNATPVNDTTLPR
ncbi:MAG: hypothetical protein V4649_05390 [Bacteroidota bacterium]